MLYNIDNYVNNHGYFHDFIVNIANGDDKDNCNVFIWLAVMFYDNKKS